METASVVRSPRRITDLIDAKRCGAEIHLVVDFEILPVDFHHRRHPFKAYIFLAGYRGAVDEATFAFRKCYARGCPNNFCTHVSQAVTIANRYLQRDYHALAAAGIHVGDAQFNLADMVVKFDHMQARGEKDLILPELIESIAGTSVEVAVALEFIPAVAHFAAQNKPQTFLSGEFSAALQESRYHSHRCLACFDSEHERAEKPPAVAVANSRLTAIYQDFARHGISYRAAYFS